MSRNCFQWSVYLVEMPDIGGSVQRGLRPCICVSNNTSNIYSNIGQFIPMTSQTKCILPTHYVLSRSEYPFLKCDSVVMAEQISTLSSDMIVSFLGRLKETDIQSVKEILKRQFSSITSQLSMNSLDMRLQESSFMLQLM